MAKKITKQDEWNDFSSNIVIGYLNGVVFSLCWSTVYGPFQQFALDATKKDIFKSIMRYHRTSLLKLPPMSALIRVTSGYFESHGYSQFVSASVSLLVCFAYLTVVKFPK